MNSTEYRKLLLLDIPVDDKRLIHYRCCQCNNIIIAISVLFGRPSSPECPICSGSLYIQISELVPFYKISGDEYFLRAGSLHPISCKFFQTQVIPLLSVPKKSTPLFLLPVESDKKSIHVVKTFDGFTPTSYCDLEIGSGRAWKICSGMTDQIPVSQICSTCHRTAIIAYNRSRNLNPTYTSTTKSKGERYRKLFQDVRILNNVKLACEINEVCRLTFYNARKNYSQLYHQIITQEN
jgi:hypothetical protein